MYKQNNENQIQIFNFESEQIRTIIIENEIYFIGKDVAEVLGYSDTDQAVRKHVFIKNKLTRKFNWSGQGREMTIINEAGMYQLIFKSRLKEAEKFQDWVSSEVLPTIRRQGFYAVQPDSYMINDPIERATRWIEEEKEREALSNKVIELAPKAEYADTALLKTNTYSATEVAKTLGISSSQKLNAVMIHHNKLYRSNKNVVFPTALMEEKGYCKLINVGNTRFDSHQTRWSEAGKQWAFNYLTKKYGADFAQFINEQKMDYWAV